MRSAQLFAPAEMLQDINILCIFSTVLSVILEIFLRIETSLVVVESLVRLAHGCAVRIGVL